MLDSTEASPAGLFWLASSFGLDFLPGSVWPPIDPAVFFVSLFFARENGGNAHRPAASGAIHLPGHSSPECSFPVSERSFLEDLFCIDSLDLRPRPDTRTLALDRRQSIGPRWSSPSNLDTSMYLLAYPNRCPPNGMARQCLHWPPVSQWPVRALFLAVVCCRLPGISSCGRPRLVGSSL